MATVQFSAFINDIRGRLGDVVHSFQKGTNYVKTYQGNITQPNTSRQIQVRASFGCLSQLWDSLTPAQQELWQGYAVSSPSLKTARGAFIRYNQNLLAASHADLVTIYSPPATPGTPAFIAGLCCIVLSSVSTCICWTKPLTSTDYISAYFNLHTGFCNNFPTYGLCTTVGYRPSNRFIGTVRSDVSFITHNHGWPIGTRLYYRVFSLDKYGRKSPWTHKIMVYVPS